MSRNKSTMTEVELAARVVAWLEAQHWDVYQEVSMGRGGLYPVADIVALQDGRAWVVEVKTSLSLAVMEQAFWWLPYAEWVSVAYPRSRTRRRRRWFAHTCLKQMGIGSIEVGSEEDSLILSVAPKLHRQARVDRHHHLRDYCHEEHKCHAVAGSKNGTRFTPYRKTIENVERILQRLGPLPVRRIVEELKTHHYATDTTARSALVKALTKWESDRFACERRGRALWFSLRENGRAHAKTRRARSGNTTGEADEAGQ